MKNIICNECNKEFNLEAKDLKSKVVDNIEVQYFECNHCNHKYITTCIDAYNRKELRRYNRLPDSDKKLKCLQNMKRHSDVVKERVKNKI